MSYCVPAFMFSRQDKKCVRFRLHPKKLGKDGRKLFFFTLCLGIFSPAGNEIGQN